MSPFPPRATSAAVGVWHASITDLLDADTSAHALAWLTPPEHERYARFRGGDDRRMFLLGRVMARSLVARALGTAPHAWQWRDGPHGRPEIAGPPTPLQ